jgi:class 3 adenylate cyclase
VESRQDQGVPKDKDPDFGAAGEIGESQCGCAAQYVVGQTGESMARPESVASLGTDAEARHVTILKFDVVGSTSVKKRLDLEGQLTFQRRLQKVVREVADRHDAHIERFDGDGALVQLGFPRPREDAPESAVRMGIELVTAIHSAEIVPNVRLDIRVGIASGVVALVKNSAGPVGDLIGGMIPDMAERLRVLADPGQVIIADATKRLAGGFFSYDDLGVVQAKGFDEGIRAWRVIGALPVASRFEAQRFDPSKAQIIGRADVLARLSEAWSHSLRGAGQAVCLVGEAGIGKSRLALDLLTAARRDGGVTLTIDCTPSTGNTPMFPVAVLLRGAANISPISSAAEKSNLAQQLLARLLPAEEVSAALTNLGPLFGLQGVAVPADVNPTEARDRMISTAVLLITRLSAERPLALLCEDLHWVDDTTASVIARVAEEIAGRRALIIVTTRPTLDEPPLNLSTFATIALEPLDPKSAADLVRATAKGVILSDEIVSRIVERCEGVPLVLEEVTRTMLEANQPDGADVPVSVDGGVPAPLQLAIQSRLYRWPQYMQIVQSASVLGREFSLQLLEKMTLGVAESEVTKTIDALTREGLIVRSDSAPGSRAFFKHAMICEAVYNTLLGSDRQRLHSEVADILIDNYEGSPDAAPDLVAEHLRKANRAIEAVRVRLAAGGDTATKGAYVESEGHCVAALAIIDEVEDPGERTSLQFKLLIQLGVALVGQYGYSAPVVEDVFRQARSACGDSADAETLYPIMRGLAALHVIRGDLAVAHDLSVQALNLADQSGRVEFRIDAMSVLCYTTLYYGKLSDCRGWIERCLDLYRAAGGYGLTYPVPNDAGTAAMALMPTVAWLLGDSQAAEAAVRDVLVHAERVDRDFDRVYIHNWISGTRYMQRRYAEALEHASIVAEISQRQGYREHAAYGTLMMGLSQSALRADPEAVAHATEVCMAFAREGVGANASYFLWGLARGHAQLGNVEVGRQLLAEGFRRAEASGETRMHSELLLLEAQFDNDDADASQKIRHALDMADEQGAVATALRAAASLALRSGCDTTEQREYTQATLDMLDGRQAYPEARDWMLQRLTALRRIIDPPRPALEVTSA